MQSSEQKIEAFAQSVRMYCQWAEEAPSNPADEIKLALKFLSDLYGKAIQLPQIKVAGGIEPNKVSEDNRQQVYKRFGSLPFNHYSQIFNPLVCPPEEPVIGDLADDLSDIYGDLRMGLSLYDGGHQQAAAWEWQLHFRIHWGRHLVAALYAMHCYAEENLFD